ncbi:biotin-dependent carboxyltransferase family protein [Actinoplanes sp. NPDC023936]|uniref:5-oxoprolinase subunit C family protein n=1 Tax=Actinoplanes sp. NPDC023936 TaxID=3154910 RepID=UPI0033F128AA
MITVLRAGPLTTVQDLGRPGYAHLGVPRSGALDIPALRRANRLAGNPDGTAGLETTLMGCKLRFETPARVAVTGAVATVKLDREPVGGPVVDVPAGGVLEIGRAVRGVRSYLAVAGGIAGEAVLGSRSTDTLAGIGPERLTDGMTLPVGTVSGGADGIAGDGLEIGEEIVLGVRLGPRDDWFDGAGLFGAPYRISPMSNRVGARLAGTAVTRTRAGELPSEGVVLGAVQVPADGQPIVFLADHPTTGGYPVIGVVGDVTPLAQARPGTTVRFRDLD